MKLATKIRKTIAEIAIGFVIGANIKYIMVNPGDDRIILNVVVSVCIMGFLMIFWAGDPAIDDTMDD